MAADQIQVTYGGSITAAANATGRLRIGPLYPGDSLDGMTLYLRTGAAHADVLGGVDVTIESYVHDAAPLDTDTAARNGRPLIRSSTIPFTSDGAGATALGSISAKLSLIHRPTQRERYVSIILTAPTNVGVTGSIWFDVFRPTRTDG